MLGKADAHWRAVVRIVGAMVLLLSLLAQACTSSGRPDEGSTSSPASQTAAGLAPAFGSGGVVTTSFTSGHDAIAAIAVQADGKIVAVGNAGSDAEFALARYNADGTLDTAFGDGGKVTTDFTKDGDWADAVALQPDGKIVVAGGAGQAGSARTLVMDFALARYNPDGSLDASFGNGGKLTTSFTPAGDYVNGIAIQPDGKIVAAGMGGDRIGYDANFALARYNPDGSLDRTFGKGGMVTTDFAQRDGANAGVMLQPDGKIVAAGVAIPGGLALARYNPDGTLDSTFGEGGKVVTPGDPSAAFRMALLPDGDILASGGGFSTDPPTFFLARYTRNGTLDRRFGMAGTIESKLLPGPFDPFVVGSGGSIIVSGPNFSVVRLRPDGSVDRTFGASGELTSDLGPGFISAGVYMGALVTDGDTGILQGGTDNISKTDSDFALVRYLAG